MAAEPGWAAFFQFFKFLKAVICAPRVNNSPSARVGVCRDLVGTTSHTHTVTSSQSPLKLPTHMMQRRGNKQREKRSRRTERLRAEPREHTKAKRGLGFERSSVTQLLLFCALLLRRASKYSQIFFILCMFRPS